jgi:hypothetical protein
LWVLIKELEILAKIEDVKEFLVPPGPKQVGAQPGAATEHLPEFRLRPHDLVKDQIDDLRHIDAGVEHVDRDRNVGRLLRLIKIIEQRLRVFGLVVDRPRERAFEMRVVLSANC